MCRYRDEARLGVVSGGQVVIPALGESWPPEIDDVLSLIAGGPALMERLRELLDSTEGVVRVAGNEFQYLAPIPRPRKNVMCLGWNYAEHVQETSGSKKLSSDLPEHPIVFTKSSSSVTGPYDEVPYFGDVTQEMDWEVELGVIIGHGGRAIAKEKALEHVFGYTVINDLSARDLQFRHQQFFLGKSLDGACPMGPWVTTADEIPDPQDLNLSCRVNGTTKQSSNTRHMIFDVATTIAVLSRGMTLEPGDVIATGTPSGVGFTREPPEFLKPGDVVECEVERIGMIRNRMGMPSKTTP